MTDPAGTSRKRLLSRILIALILVVCAFTLVRGAVPRSPVPFVHSRAVPQNALWHEGAWYWIEAKTGEPARLVRAEGSGAHDIAAADEIGGFAFTADGLAWSARSGGLWSIVAGRPDGSAKRTVNATGPVKPQGICASNGHLYWLEQTPPAIPDSGPLPPLGPACRVVSADLSGGRTAVLATLMEPTARQVLGAGGRDLFVSTFRPGALGVTAFYKVPLDGGPPQRLAGTPGPQTGLLTRDGDLYWAAASQEATTPGSTSCVRRLGKDGRPETLAEWLPFGGRLLETSRGVVYVDGAYVSRAWPIGRARELPRPFPVPEGYSIMGIGETEALIRPITEEHPGTISLFRMALP